MKNSNQIVAVLVTLVLTVGLILSCAPTVLPPSKPDGKLPSTSAVTQPPVIKYFVADPNEIGIDDLAMLKWEVSGVQNISIDHGVGEASSIGDRKVSPKVTTIYTLTATNPAGAVSSTATVSVVGNVNAAKIALTRDDVRFYGFTFSSGDPVQVADTLSAYSVSFVKGKETLTNTVYVYPLTSGGAELKFYTLEPQYKQNNQTLYSIGNVQAYVVVDRAGTTDDTDRYGIRFLKNNVWVHLGFISNYQALETLAKMLVSRVH